jgi:hypothetical protein
MDDADSQHAERRTRRAPIRHLVFGLMFIVGGSVLTLKGLDIAYVFGLWPLVLVGLGIDRILGGCCARRRRSGVWLLAIGSWLSLNAFTALRYRDTWPLLLVAVGALIVWDAVAPSGDRCPLCAEGRHAH